MGYIFSSLRYAGKVVEPGVKGVRSREDNTEPERSPLLAGLGKRQELRQQARDPEKYGLRLVAGKERRKISQRVLRQPVLVELRCGIDRRRRHQRKSDIVVCIDETA